MKAHTLVALAAIVLLAAAAPVHAQTPVANPKTVTFTISPDNSVTSALTGAPLLDHYDLHANTAAPVNPDVVQNLGKPAPDAAGTDAVALSSAFLASLAPNMVYSATVYAVDAAGNHTQSGASNPFGVAGPPRPPSSPQVK